MFGFAASPPYFFHWECVQYFEWGFVAMYANQTNLSVVYAVEVVIAKQSVVVNSEWGERSFINFN